MQDVGGSGLEGGGGEIVPSCLPELQGVLERLNPKIPQVFRDQAKKAAEFITGLEKGETQNDEVELFLEELSGTSLFQRTCIKSERDARQRLPLWLLVAVKAELGKPKFGRERELEVNEAYDVWVRSEHYFPREHKHGITYYIREDGQSKEYSPDPKHYKCYLDTFDSYEGLVVKKALPSIFKEMKERGIGPWGIKNTTDGVIAMYFDNAMVNAELVRGLFEENGLKIRGPAQDVVRIDPKEGGELICDFYESNDGALSAGGHNSELFAHDYQLRQFYESYLRVCLRYGKDPSEPYKTSFVYLKDSDGVLKDNIDKSVAEAGTWAGYPVAYINNRQWLDLYELGMLQEPEQVKAAEPEKRTGILSRFIRR